MTNANDKTYSLKVEKTFNKPASDVFRAIGEGRLFMNCSAQQDTLKVDFRTGGKYQIEFRAFEMWNQGEFLEVTPHSKIVFTWCQDGKKDAKPDTKVTVLLSETAGKTHLFLTHEGFRDQEIANDHQSGWSGGLEDLSREMTEGRLKFNRYFNAPVTRLYELCANPVFFFGMISDVSKGKVDFRVGGEFRAPSEGGEIHGKFLEIVPNEKIVFSWLSGCGEPLKHPTKVTLSFESDEDDTSWLELIHEGLDSEYQIKSHREGWDYLFSRLMEKVNS